MTKEYPWGKGTPKFTRDASANDSDKSFTVPVGKIWSLKYISATLGSTATVGNRVLALNITNGTNVILLSEETGNLAASLTAAAQWTFGQSATKSTSVVGIAVNDSTGINVGLLATEPEILLPAGYVIRVWDRAAIDAAADDLTVVLHYIEYDA